MHKIPLMIHVRIKGDRVYLLLNLIEVGFWPAEDLAGFKKMIDEFLQQRADMSEMIFPRLEYCEDCDPGVIQSERAARSYALIEAAAACAVRAEEIRAAAGALPGRGALIQRAEHDARANEMDIMAMFLRARAKGGK